MLGPLTASDGRLIVSTSPNTFVLSVRWVWNATHGASRSRRASGGSAPLRRWPGRLAPAEGRVRRSATRSMRSASGTSERSAGPGHLKTLRGLLLAMIPDVAFQSGRPPACAVGQQDGTVEALGLRTPAARSRAFRGHTSTCRCGWDFSPDGRRIVSCGGDATIKVWDADASEVLPVRTIGWGFRVAYSPDGCRLVYTFFEQVLILDAATGRVVREIHAQAIGGRHRPGIGADGQVAGDPLGILPFRVRLGRGDGDAALRPRGAFGRSQVGRPLHAGPSPRRATTAPSGSGTPRTATPASCSAGTRGAPSP